MKKLVLFGLSILILSNCNNSPENSSERANSEKEENLGKGFQLVENYCFNCHSPNASLENRIAPPMEAVKRHYITGKTSENEFIQDLIRFLNDPADSISKMPNAVAKFGLMPKMSFPEMQIREIGKYIFRTELEKPGWFENHYQAERKRYASTTNTLSPLEQGQELAMKTKAVLGKNLLNAINSKGTEHAVEFCSTRALTLTDSMATVLNASVRRVSDKNRNPKNAASPDELSYILKSKTMISNNEKPTPQITEKGNKLIGYYPIMMEKICLQCHGAINSEVLPGARSKIRNAYPADKATGYKVNELRGIWVVEMDKSRFDSN